MNPEILLIRLGYGLSPDQPASADPGDYLASVSRAAPDGSVVDRDKLIKMNLTRQKLAKRAKQQNDKGAKGQIRKMNQQANVLAMQSSHRRLARAVGDPQGFGERLVQFWADHFTVRSAGVFGQAQAAAFVEDAIRPHIGGRFADLMLAAETHPAMLLYLNQAQSVGPDSELATRRKAKNLGLNENLAREMIELHSLGVNADYTQKDVRQLAELLTGLTYLPTKSDIFQPNMAEPGAETVLGKSYGGDGPAKLGDISAVIETLATHEATATHIARKLAVHFVSDNPPPALIDRLARAFAEAQGDLPTVYAVLLNAPELVTEFRQKVRQPFDFIVASLRALGLREQDVMDLEFRRAVAMFIRPQATMGQPWGLPTGPNGWPEEAESWTAATGLAARIDWAFHTPEKLRRNLPDPRILAKMSLGSTLTEPLRWAVSRAATKYEGVGIILASSEFNRR